MKKVFLFIIVSLFFQNISANNIEKKFWYDYQILLNNILIRNEYVYEGQSFTHNGINYQRLYNNENEILINNQLSKLNNFNLKNMKTNSINTQLAFWINVYNFFTLMEIKRFYPISSMEKIGWDNKVVAINQKALTLDEVEHEIIRPLKEPRIHFAINCASVSCPTLNDTIYEGDLLNHQLDFAVRNAFKNPLHIRIEDSLFGERMYVTKILSWFDKDFGTDAEILSFIHSYAPEIYKKYINYSFIRYNWDINTTKNISNTLNKLLDKLSK